MNDDGEVSSGNVRQVLNAHNVTISRQGYGGFKKHRLAKDNVVIAIDFGDFFSKRMVQYLKRMFNIPIDHFYHPERAQVPLKEVQLPDSK